jgi:hypothetical protein
MKMFWMWMLLWMGMLGNPFMVAADADASDPLAQAERVVSAYLGALVQGDLETIRQLLGGSFLRKKEMLLNNPDYSARLVELYSGASYEITRLEGEVDGRSAVDVHLDMGTGGVLGTRFIVDRIAEPSTGQSNYLITDELVE